MNAARDNKKKNGEQAQKNIHCHTSVILQLLTYSYHSKHKNPSQEKELNLQEKTTTMQPLTVQRQIIRLTTSTKRLTGRSTVTDRNRKSCTLNNCVVLSMLSPITFLVLRLSPIIHTTVTLICFIIHFLSFPIT